jgi:hypothetical protein
MLGRRGHVRRIAERLASEGDLKAGWTVEHAAELIFVVTLPGPWRTLTATVGWSQKHYRDELTELLERSLLNQTGGRRSVSGTST